MERKEDEKQISTKSLETSDKIVYVWREIGGRMRTSGCISCGNPKYLDPIKQEKFIEQGKILCADLEQRDPEARRWYIILVSSNGSTSHCLICGLSRHQPSSWNYLCDNPKCAEMYSRGSFIEMGKDGLYVSYKAIDPAIESVVNPMKRQELQDNEFKLRMAKEFTKLLPMCVGEYPREDKRNLQVHLSLASSSALWNYIHMEDYIDMEDSLPCWYGSDCVCNCCRNNWVRHRGSINFDYALKLVHRKLLLPARDDVICRLTELEGDLKEMIKLWSCL